MLLDDAVHKFGAAMRKRGAVGDVQNVCEL
jgi:hypothetical protein